jgi:allantoinase
MLNAPPVCLPISFKLSLRVMPEFDLLIRGARPLPEIGIADGKIVGFASGSAREEIDASGLIVLPGVVDAHVHFNEPGRTDWEGWETGSCGAVAGGVTTVCDMPLNSTPPVMDAKAFDAKFAAAKEKSVCDFALWGGLTSQNVDRLEELAARGVMGFKAFMAHSGIDDFPRADLATLRAGMKRAVKLNLPVAVHAEFDRDLPRPGTGVRDYLASRPIESECAAIAAALEIAGETGCALHVVHVSSSEGLSLIADAKRRGVNATSEVCAHYLIFTGEDVERLGAVAKCAPPMRDAGNLAALWKHVRAGNVDTLGSDHSPSPWKLKEHADFFKVWGGISGVQHLLPVLLDGGLEPVSIARLASEAPARRFRLPDKGKLEVGADADLSLVDLRESTTVCAEDLFYRHKHSPYIGRCLRARVRRTILRGKTVFLDGKIVGPGGGKLIKPL